MAYNGSTEIISGLRPKNNAGFPVADAKDIRIDDNTRLDVKMGSIANTVETLRTTSSGRPILYCYGDSLTEGVGGYVSQPDSFNAYMDYSYPAWLSQAYDVVNMGARGEDIPTIMGRQGGDPMVLSSSITIPADLTPVKIGECANIYEANQTGLATKSGKVAYPLREVEAFGINPCTIAGVEGILYREMGSSAPSTGGSFDYYFKRLKAGTAKTVPQDTEIHTFAMRNYRNGIAIIWMGANGGAASATDFINKVNAMLDFGQYITYVVIIGREWSGENLAAIKAAFTDDGEDGVCHVVALEEQLPYRGYGLAGIPYQPVDTSQWTTTDPIKKNAPVLCEYISGQTGENQYGSLHFSAWGYKAIAKLVMEKLGEMGLVSGGSAGAGPSTAGADDYGYYLYKLETPKTLTGYNYINTKVKLYDDVDKDWTFAIKWSGTPSTPDATGWPANIFCCALDAVDTPWKGLLYRYSSTGQGMILFGGYICNLNYPGYNADDHWGETNVCIVVKSGSTYHVRLNNVNYIGGTAIESPVSEDYAIKLPLIIGARYNAEGTLVTHKTTITVEDCRVYNDALDEETAYNLYQEMIGAEEESST